MQILLISKGGSHRFNLSPGSWFPLFLTSQVLSLILIIRYLEQATNQLPAWALITIACLTSLLYMDLHRSRRQDFRCSWLRPIFPMPVIPCIYNINQVIISPDDFIITACTLSMVYDRSQVLLLQQTISKSVIIMLPQF